MTERKRAGVGFWVTIGLAAILIYALSWGPACWLWVNGHVPDWAASSVHFVYRPIGLLYERGPQPIPKILNCYAALWMPALPLPQ